MGGGVGAEDSRFLFLKLQLIYQGFGDPAVQATGSCTLRGTTTWGAGGGGKKEGGRREGRATPVSATLSTPFLIIQTWVSTTHCFLAHEFSFHFVEGPSSLFKQQTY